MFFAKAALTVISFISRAIQALELFLAYRAGVAHQVASDRGADLAKLQAELKAANNAGTANESLGSGKF